MSGLRAKLLPRAVKSVRKLADRQRQLAEEWSGRDFPAPYPELPSADQGAALRAQLASREGQVWRDWRWANLHPYVGGLIAFAPLALVLSGVWGLLTAVFGVRLSQEWDSIWYLFVPVQNWPTAALAGVLGALQFPLAFRWAAPRAVSLHERYLRAMLAPSEDELRAEMAEMAHRIDHLTTTRTAAVDTQMAEIRRIERDLHDGAQARLVAMGMTLDAAEHLLESNPEAVRALLAEARENSTKALQELRDLVRGIHPPVLADRGLADAVRSLALISPLRTEVRADLPARPEPPVESAAYFAVSELMTNAAKHSGAGRARIDISHEPARPDYEPDIDTGTDRGTGTDTATRTGPTPGTLRIKVTDDGRGGADATRGTGLRGIEQRLATFDGVLTVSSPLGGPTTVTLEVPCALSSPKTTSC
ncbi:sensor histidine kinase [Streptomyces sp. WAC 01529]|uniref:sensor histidine kinase n=1 Tax=Streptomyces sp. WAC 01529 TaxID=2203205 RepID=UPI000F7133B5|nr:histidine kinase [Streptomyces sp. WAC 01529]AZM54624.1 sensor histidine kinase [Streptomyces sp. WAC 01529]